MKNKFLIGTSIILVIGVLFFYIAPVKVVGKILQDPNYFGQNQTEVSAVPVIRAFDYTVFSENTIEALVEAGLVELKHSDNKTEQQTILADHFIDPEEYKDIISSLRLSRRFYTPTISSFSSNEVLFEINPTAEYKLYLGEKVNEMHKVGQNIPYYYVTNHEEITNRLIEAIDSYFE